MELKKDTGNTLQKEVLTTSRATAKRDTVIPGDSETEWKDNYLAQQCLSLELGSPVKLFNKHQILQVCIKGNFIQLIYTREYFSQSTFPQMIQLIAAMYKTSHPLCLSPTAGCLKCHNCTTPRISQLLSNIPYRSLIIGTLGSAASPVQLPCSVSCTVQFSARLRKPLLCVTTESFSWLVHSQPASSATYCLPKDPC